jgi:hypothetical protein
VSSTVGGTQLERFESRFLPLLNEATSLSTLTAEIIEDFRLDGVAGDKFPEATVLRLLMGTDPLYKAAIHCLDRADTSFGAYALLRPLLDSWAHLWHLMNSGTARAGCQALRIELGWAMMHVEKLKASSDADAARGLPAAEGRLKEIRQLFADHRCKGGTRTYSHVGHTLKEMQVALNAPWLPDMHDGSSRVIHASGHDWLTMDNGDGTSSLIDPMPSQRAARLNHLTILFHSCSATALVLLGLQGDSPAQARLSENANRILHSRFLKRVIDGDYDPI